MDRTVELRGRGMRGQRGLASGPLGEGSVTSVEITNDPVEQAAILAKIGGSSGGGGGGGPVDALYASDRINLAKARLLGETDVQAFNRLVAAGIRRFYAPDGQGLTNGAYLIGCDPWTNGSIQNPNSPDYDPNATIDDLIEAAGNIVSGLDILGDGKGKSVFLQGDFNYGFMGNALGGPNIQSPSFYGVTLVGNNANYTVTSQTFHNIAAFGIDNLIVENCELRASPGDGIYLARGPKQTSPNHNTTSIIHNNYFNGVNNINRNPVSVEDATTVNFTDNVIEDFTKNGEPGWDIEPVITSSQLGQNIFQVGQIVVTGNTWRRCNGVAFCLQMDVRLSAKYGGMIIVANNTVENCFSFVDIVGPPDDQNNVTRGFSCIIHNNTVRNLAGPIGRVGGALDVDIHHNKFEDADLLRFGYGWGNRFINVNDNKFTRCGRTNGFVFIANLDARHVNLDNNEYVSCGRTDGLGSNAILLTQDGANEYGTPANTVVPRVMGISIRGGRVVNTKADGTAGVLTHFAINNATGGYGPGASKGGTLFYGTPIPNPDTFNPPAPVGGKRVVIPFGGRNISSIQNGIPGVEMVDFGLGGLTPSTHLRVYPDVYLGQPFSADFRAKLVYSVYPTSSTTGTIAVLNYGQANQNTGTANLIVEEVS